MKRVLFPFAMALALAAPPLLVSAPASADGTSMHLCNKSSVQIAVAAGYYSSGASDASGILTGPFVSRGWWVLDPGDCKYMANPFAARYMFWLAYAAGGDFLWSQGDRYFCVPNIAHQPPEFTMEKQNVSEDACTGSYNVGSGPNQWEPAREVDVDVNPNVTYNG